MIFRRLVLLVSILLLCGVAFAWYLGGKLMEPVPRGVGTAPVELAATPIQFPSESGSLIHGWFSPGRPGAGAVLLLHGVRADRTDMLSRGLFLHRLGYGVLLIDLQAHGESLGQHITFGGLESWDVVAATSFLHRTLPGERIGVIGVSLGAASVVLAKKPLGVSAVVLESMYPTIEDAVADRLKLHLSARASAAAPLLLMQLKPRLGMDPGELRPIDHIAQLGAPLLLIHGDLDQHTTLNEARRIFSAAAEPKSSWEVRGAAHVNLHRFAKQEYETRIAAWFERYLVQHLPAPVSGP